jgi:polyhydroxyalkanoate synthesis repressor PhaR
MTVLIKRYANRKLYDTEASRYITLKGVSELVRAGRDIQVIDNESGEDITPLILSQILVDGQKQTGEHDERSVPHTVLTELIQKGGDALATVLRRSMDDVSENLSDVRDGMRRWIDRNPETEGIDSATISRTVHEAVERVMRVVDLPTRGDVEALNKNIERLANALEALENRLSSSRRD